MTGKGHPERNIKKQVWKENTPISLPLRIAFSRLLLPLVSFKGIYFKLKIVFVKMT